MFASLKSWLRPTPPSTAARPRLGLQHLEAREVPATLLYLSGTLVVDGTAGNDNLEIARSGSTMRVLQIGRPDRMEREVNTSVGVGRIPVSSYSISDVRGVTVNGLGGSDLIDVRQSPVRAIVAAGDGNDTVYGSAFNDFITGGNGNDRIAAYAGDDNLLGNDGDDTLEGGDGNDNLQGWNGNDRLLGQGGVDTLDGGMGDSDAADALYGVDVTRNLENSTVGGAPLVVGGATANDVNQTSRPYCVFYSHVSGMAGILSARGRNLADERIDFKGRNASGNNVYDVKMFTSSGSPVTRTVTYNGPMAGDAEAVGGEGWVTILEKAFMDQIHAEDPTGSLWRRYWDHNTVMMMTNGSSEAVHMIDNFTAAFGANLGHEHFNTIATAIEAGKLVTASSWTAGGRGTSTPRIVREHNYTVVGVNRVAGTVTVRNPWGFDGGAAIGNTSDGLIVLSWADFRGSFQGYNVGVVA